MIDPSFTRRSSADGVVMTFTVETGGLDHSTAAAAVDGAVGDSVFVHDSNIEKARQLELACSELW